VPRRSRSKALKARRRIVLRAAAAAVLAALPACSTRPKPSPGLVALARNPKAVVSGIVRDSRTGKPIEGIEVFGLPEGKDFPWGPPGLTDSDGRFTVALGAPAKYSFLLRWHGISVVTPEKNDPAYVEVATEPGGRIEGVELKFLREKFQEKTP
jgi:hypothetical protein